MGSRIIYICLLFTSVLAVSKREGDFYPFGHHVGDKSLSSLNEDSTSEEIRLPKPVYFFGVPYHSVHVNENGLISFEADVPYFQNQDIARSADYALIAAFYADVDIRNTEDPRQPHGHVYYRVTEDQELRERATRFVRSKFPDAHDFDAKWLLITTWDEVGYYDRGHDKRNTFQTILIASDSQTYVELLYDMDGIQWINTADKSGSGQTKAAQVGFISDDARSKIMEHSGTESIMQINRRSNLGENGRYLFRVSSNDVVGPNDIKSRTSERLQPLDIGGPSGVVGAGTHSSNPENDDDDDDSEYEVYDQGDADVVYDDGAGHHIRPGNRGHNPPIEEPAATQAPLAPAPPAPGPDDPGQETPQEVKPVEPEPEPTTALIVEDDSDDVIIRPAEAQPTPAPAVTEGSHHHPPPYEPPTDADDDDDDDDDDAPTPPAPAAPHVDHQYPQPQPQPQPYPYPYPQPHPDHQQPHPDHQQPQQPYPHYPQPPQPAHSQPLPGPHVPQHHGPVAPGLTCAQGGANMCHANAECRDYGTGSCCECQYGYTGNGKECLKEGDPQRINGRFYGRLNDIDIPETDLHTYAVTTDGRAYTALSQIPEQLGRPLLLLGTIGGVFGWLYAKPSSPNAYNGFWLSGGILNRTVTVHLSDRYTVTIQQDFTGKDEFGYMKARIYVTGSLPDIPEGVEVEYGEYKEEYTRHGAGIVKSYSSKVVTAGSERYQMTIDQTIRFDECQHKQFNKHHTMTLQVDRSYNQYDPKERIVRYAAANTIELAGDTSTDPCREGQHDCVGPHMHCITDGQSYRCGCASGYELAPPRGEADRRGVCVDLDECARSLDRCDQEADCFNTEGGYQCLCRPGYRGDGYTCAREEPPQLPQPQPPPQPPQRSCADLRCDRNAECRPNRYGQLECLCRPGFKGDGYYCTEEQAESIGPICTSHDQCHRHGQCVYNQAIFQYQCQCRPPYSGDGKNCFLEAESCDKARNCDANADCIWTQTEIGGGYQCRCRTGYAGDGRRCTRVENAQDAQCNVVNNCHVHAQCKFNSNVGRFVCECLSGYDGDGFSCVAKLQRPTGDRRCQSVDDCHAYGHCVNQGDEYVCECLPGFKGDGMTSCEPADQCNPGSTAAGQCDPNAACLYDDQEHAYVCKCKEGYHGDGKVCGHGPVTCDRNPGLCHRDAQCSWTGSAYTCQCRSGFKGDGRTCEADRASCENQNICHPHAQCQRNRAGEFRCVCNAGYEGDGTNCHPAQDCLANQRLCDANAVCVSENFRYVCRCRPGYHGSGLACSADSELRGRTLVFTQGVALVQRGMASDDLGKQITVVPHQIAVGLDYDCQDDKLFWTDVSGHAVRSAYTDGSNLTTLFTEGLNSPEGLVVDWASKNVYYTDSQLDIIGVARQDGKYRTALVKDGLVNPRALAIDLYEKKLYYSDWYRTKPVIGRLNLDGSGREDFITNEIALPNGLVILHRRRQLCWADAGMQRLECIGLNGSGRRVIYAPLGYPFGLTVHNEETFFWTDWEDTKIHSVSINGGNHHSFIPSLGGSGKLYGIVLIPEQCPPGESPCAVNNGGCRYLCLPDSRGSRSCVCPDNIPESECNQLNGEVASMV